MLSMYMHICIHTLTHIHMCVCVHVYIQLTNIYTYMYTYMYSNTNICTPLTHVYASQNSKEHKEQAAPFLSRNLTFKSYPNTLHVVPNL